ncbi:MAG: endonuclease MutS2 [Anaerolineae bacterium]
MDARSLRVLEFDRIRERLAQHASFSLGRERALALLPSDDLREAQAWQAETREARRLLAEKSDVHLGGVHDLRPLVEQAVRGSTLLPLDLLNIRSTLTRGRTLQRMLGRLAEQFPHLADIAGRIAVPSGLIEEITRCIDERGEMTDNASEALARIRRELREAHARLMERLQRIISTPSNLPLLQEALITQRQGRYVIPLRAEFKGRIPGLIHDQSGSGATLFIEPLAVVDLNNQWRQAQLAEQEEIQRILAALTGLVAAAAGEIVRTVDALGDLDLVFAKARYADELRATEPMLVPFKPVGEPAKRGKTDHRVPTESRAAGEPTDVPLSVIRHPGSTLALIQARHPLLDPLTVVPVDIYLEDDYFIVVITGPNTGGKTVSLKTTGLLTLMAQAGMAIPAAEGSKVSVFEGVFADIGDEQSIQQSLSTFSSHMTHIVDILARADERSLVLLDELGAGTDPEEGAALAQALLKTLLARRITTFATTHYSELKVFAHTTPFVVNASVEFDIQTLSPTYELSIGLPGRSNAFAIARRLGLAEEIIAQAEALVSPQSLEAEAMLAEIKRARAAALSAEAEAKAALRRAEALQADLNYRLAKVEEARRAVLAEARSQAEAELAGLRADIERIRAQLATLASGDVASAGKSLHDKWLAEAAEVLARGAAQVQPLPPPRPAEPMVVEGPLQVGDQVWIESLQTAGEIVGLNDNEAEVKIGSFRVRMNPSRLTLRQRGGQPAVQAGVLQPRPPSPGMELDLRGMTVDDMLMELDRYLDLAYRAGLPFVRIIHGKGTGALRQAVRNELKGHSLVSEFRPGEPGEGGEGVTIARLVQH